MFSRFHTTTYVVSQLQCKHSVGPEILCNLLVSALLPEQDRGHRLYMIFCTYIHMGGETITTQNKVEHFSPALLFPSGLVTDAFF